MKLNHETHKYHNLASISISMKTNFYIATEKQETEFVLKEQQQLNLSLLCF